MIAPPPRIETTLQAYLEAKRSGNYWFMKGTWGERVNKFNPRGESPGPMRQAKPQDHSQTTYYHPHLRLALCYPN